MTAQPSCESILFQYLPFDCLDDKECYATNGIWSRELNIDIDLYNLIMNFDKHDDIY